MTDAQATWMLVGAGGQMVFSLRFVLQWIHSERRRQSTIPLSFWYASLAGAVALFAYAVHRRDPVFITAQTSGFFVYARNLQLRLRESRRSEATP